MRVDISSVHIRHLVVTRARWLQLQEAEFTKGFTNCAKPERIQSGTFHTLELKKGIKKGQRNPHSLSRRGSGRIIPRLARREKPEKLDERH